MKPQPLLPRNTTPGSLSPRPTSNIKATNHKRSLSLDKYEPELAHCAHTSSHSGSRPGNPVGGDLGIVEFIDSSKPIESVKSSTSPDQIEKLAKRLCSAAYTFDDPSNEEFTVAEKIALLDRLIDTTDDLRKMIRKENGTKSSSVSVSSSSAFSPSLDLNLTRGQRMRIQEALKEKLDPVDVSGMDWLLKSSSYLKYLIEWHIKRVRKTKYDDYE